MTASSTLPALFVVDRDPRSLAAMVSALVRRYGNDYRGPGRDVAGGGAGRVAAEGECTASRWRCCSSTTSDADLLARAHEMHPHAKRVLLIDRDYSTNSPAVQAIALGRADYHIVRPWADAEMLYGPMSEYLSAWTQGAGTQLRGVPDRCRGG